MFGRARHFVLALAAPWLLTGQLLAQDMGRVVAHWQGAPKSWQLVTDERLSGPVHAAELAVVRLGYEITLQAVGDPADPRRDTISFELLLVPRDDGTVAVRAADMLYLPRGMSGPFWSSRGNALTLELLDFDLWGDVGSLEAVFDGTLCRRVQLSVPIDRDTCHAINGFITTELRRR